MLRIHSRREKKINKKKTTNAAALRKIANETLDFFF